MALSGEGGVSTYLLHQGDLMPGPTKIGPKSQTASSADNDRLNNWLRRQSILTGLRRRVCATGDLDQLFEETVRLCAEGVGTNCCKLLQFLPESNCLLVRAGVGWKPGVVGQTSLAADIDSPSGCAFRAGGPVIFNRLDQMRRFRIPSLLIEHGIRRTINVPIALSQGHSWGVLSADSCEEGRFDEADLEFMQGVAQAIGVVIERDRVQRCQPEVSRLLRGRKNDDRVVAAAARWHKLPSD